MYFHSPALRLQDDKQRSRHSSYNSRSYTPQKPLSVWLAMSFLYSKGRVEGLLFSYHIK